MPRDGTSNYSLPAGTLVNTGDTILVSQHNPAMQDIAAALTGSLARNGSGGMQAPLNMNGFTVSNVADGVSPGDAVNLGQMTAFATVPVGGVIDFWGDIPPTGWLLCYGQEVSRATYANLFAAIGTAAGAGNGSTTFNVPDYRGLVSAGKADMGGTLSTRLSNFAATVLNSIFGSQSHTLTAAQMPTHTHTTTAANAGSHTHPLLVGDGFDGATYLDLGGEGAGSWINSRNQAAGDHTHVMTVANAGGSEAHPIVQPTIICNKIIRVSNA